MTTIELDGFSIINKFIPEPQVNEILSALERRNVLDFDDANASGFNLLRTIPAVEQLASSTKLLSIVRGELGVETFPVNAVLLDKSLNQNWGLDWHQDLKIAVTNKIEVPGYEYWTKEYGINHCIPPLEILEKLLSVRVHLDRCTIENGALLVIPESHKSGILSNQDLKEIVLRDATCCEIDVGGIMCMKPLLLHKSPYSISRQKRRVIQINYSGGQLDDGLQWHR
jgi:ectoine hydroxylase-related dioxygenase (phytanoyl-CoA dioxygenase family)